LSYSTWAPLTAFTATLLAVWWLSKGRFSSVALDRPNQRSLHEAPVPRTGGIGIHLGVLMAWAIVGPDLPHQTWLAFMLLLFVSFVDDLRGVPAGLRLAAHLLGAGVFTVSLAFQDHGLLTVLLGALAIAWMTNLYNFMDGSDGLAGGMTAFGFLFYAIAAWLSGDSPLALLSLSVAAAAAAFLMFNFHPARIFLGDAGSVPLGFLAGAIGFAGWVQQHWPWWFPLAVFSPFVVDASVTLLRRLVRGERIWQAHREHFYQRLVQMGWGHRNTAIAEYGLMFASGSIALVALATPPSVQVGALIIAAACYAGLIVWVERGWRRLKRNSAQ
jgi:UDP-N-acetylmuramyl pentapeptide phosphotransferase/UDP-N-acetylglucosamine-1-phosphate transferase